MHQLWEFPQRNVAQLYYFHRETVYFCCNDQHTGYCSVNRKVQRSFYTYWKMCSSHFLQVWKWKQRIRKMWWVASPRNGCVGNLDITGGTATIRGVRNLSRTSWKSVNAFVQDIEFQHRYLGRGRDNGLGMFENFTFQINNICFLRKENSSFQKYTAAEYGVLSNVPATASCYLMQSHGRDGSIQSKRLQRKATKQQHNGRKLNSKHYDGHKMLGQWSILCSK